MHTFKSNSNRYVSIRSIFEHPCLRLQHINNFPTFYFNKLDVRKVSPIEFYTITSLKWEFLFIYFCIKRTRKKLNVYENHIVSVRLCENVWEKISHHKCFCAVRKSKVSFVHFQTSKNYVNFFVKRRLSSFPEIIFLYQWMNEVKTIAVHVKAFYYYYWFSIDRFKRKLVSISVHKLIIWL